LVNPALDALFRLLLAIGALVLILPMLALAFGSVVLVSRFRKVLAMSLGAVLLAGCGAANPTSSDAVTEKEAFALSEVARFSALLHKNIGAKLSDDGLRIPAGTGACPKDAPLGYCSAAAWYLPPVVFWREFVNRESTTFGNLTDTAAHECCHSLTRGHNLLLWNCIRSLGAEPQFVPVEES